MTLNGWLQILFFLLAVFVVTPPLGGFMARVFAGQRTFLDPVMRPIERLIYRLTGVDERRGMRWTEYATALLLFSVVSLVVLYAMQRLQSLLPVEPAGLRRRRPRPRLQYGGVVHDQHQLAGVQRRIDDELFHADGRARLPQLRVGGRRHRGGDRLHPRHRQKETDTIGNFWVDLVRASLWVLLPIAVVGSLFLVSQGVVQNLKAYDTVQTVEGGKQVIAQGPAASQEIIKQFGTNGGGFFNANSAHPYENPTPLTNFLAMFGIFAISSALTYTLGTMTGSRGHGWAVWAAMAFLFLAGVSVAYWAEARGNPLLTAAGADQTATAASPGGNMEGKEVRFGIANTALFATVTTDASCGAVNGWHDSFTPLGGLVPLANMQLSEVVFGGVGAGMYGMLVYIILSVFIAGLMVGRTPEYLGKKIQAFEVQMAMLTVLIFSLLILDVHRDLVGLARLRHVEHLQPRPARALRDALRLFVGRRQQRLGVRRHQRQHEVVQHDARPGDAVRAVLHDHPAARHRRQPEPQEADSAVARHVPGDDAALHGAAGRRHRDRRRADVLPGAQPRADRRALPDARTADEVRSDVERPPSGHHDTNATSTRLNLGSGRSSGGRSRIRSASCTRGRWPGTRSCSSSRSAAC